MTRDILRTFFTWWMPGKCQLKVKLKQKLKHEASEILYVFAMTEMSKRRFKKRLIIQL